MSRQLVLIFSGILIAAVPVHARTITGRIVVPPEITSSPGYRVESVRMVTEVQAPQIAYPDDYVTWTAEQRHAWYLDFLKTPPGQVYKAALDKADADKHVFKVSPAADGAFSSDEILAGVYRISGEIHVPGSSGETHYIATGTDLVTVPNGASERPIDIGAIALTAIKTLEVGDVAPDFAVTTLDGKDLKLADFKGKFVLLNFWASWCGPCVAEIPALKSAYDAHGGDPRFAIISLALDTSVQRAEHIVEKNQIDWPQGFLGDWFKSSVRESYGVQKIPAIFLIGRDGKIIAKDLPAEQIKAAVDVALGK